MPETLIDYDLDSFSSAKKIEHNHLDKLNFVNHLMY